MKQYGLNELREMFLSYFEKQQHLRMQSFSLIPHNDNSLLLINSGMAPLKPYFTGAEIPPRNRVTTCQKCIRTGDIENVGKTSRHGTFFEMLGNFSFGDYFKKEAIPWAWEFLTKVVGLDENRLYPSVYVDDDEAYQIWERDMKIDPKRIFKFGKEDNFWEHGSGPCGPCSEIYYDRGEKYGCGRPECTVGCECDRYIEVWNIVFSQFNNDGKGNYTELEHKNIDTGMGLERLAVVVQDVDSIFDVDTIRALRDEVCKMANVTYGADAKTDVSIRVITDHIRSATFMISDGIMPTNEGRGYVLRRLIRRASRHGRLLGIDQLFLSELAEAVMESSREAYPELKDKKTFIVNVLRNEEKQFNKTLDQGLGILNQMIEALAKENQTVLDGANAFKLYDTYGFPMDLTQEILDEKGYRIDEEGFAKHMQIQQEKARSARKTSNYMGADATVYDLIDPSVTSEFTGYFDHLTDQGKILVLAGETELKDSLVEGQLGTVITDRTPFYGTMGGQQGDIGMIETELGSFRVTDTIHLRGGKIGHVGRMEKGILSVGDSAALKVDAFARHDTAKNHSATHLLQKALKTVLGSHVEQKGSYVAPGRLRFDFAHFQAMTSEEIKAVEELVNREIEEGLSVDTELMTLEEARKSGAMALFDEKYGDEVRVVSMGDFSKELCGGTHVSNTGEIQYFKILSETGISAGVRRIEALTGKHVVEHLEQEERVLFETAQLLKTEPSELTDKIAHLLQEMKQLQAENESMKHALASNALGEIEDQIQEVSGIKLLATQIPDTDGNELRNLGDQLKDQIGEGVILLASEVGGKVNLLAMATPEAVKLGAHAGNLIKEAAKLVGGGGGGRPNMAQAGGKNPAGIPDVIRSAAEMLKAQLN